MARRCGDVKQDIRPQAWKRAYVRFRLSNYEKGKYIMMTFTKDYFDLGGSVYFYSEVDKLPHTKENALLHHLAMDCRSWTFARLTQEEKES